MAVSTLAGAAAFWTSGASLAATPPQTQLEITIDRCASPTSSVPSAPPPMRSPACPLLLHLTPDVPVILGKQLEAVGLGGNQTAAFSGGAGQITLTTRVLSIPSTNDLTSRECRFAQSEIQVEGQGAAALGAQLYCRSGAEWLPAAQ